MLVFLPAASSATVSREIGNCGARTAICHSRLKSKLGPVRCRSMVPMPSPLALSDTAMSLRSPFASGTSRVASAPNATAPLAVKAT